MAMDFLAGEEINELKQIARGNEVPRLIGTKHTPLLVAASGHMEGS
jgi:hypothetical protein